MQEDDQDHHHLFDELREVRIDHRRGPRDQRTKDRIAAGLRARWADPNWRARTVASMQGIKINPQTKLGDCSNCSTAGVKTKIVGMPHRKPKAHIDIITVCPTCFVRLCVHGDFAIVSGCTMKGATTSVPE